MGITRCWTQVVGQVKELSDCISVKGSTRCQELGNVEDFQATRAVLEYRYVDVLPVHSSESGDGYLDGGWEVLSDW